MLTRNVAKNNVTNSNMLFGRSMPVSLLLMLLLSFCQGSLLPLQSDLKRPEVPATTAANAAVNGGAVAAATADSASEARGSIDSNLNLLPRPATLLLDGMPSAATAQLYPVNLTRQHEGDIFWTNGKLLR